MRECPECLTKLKKFDDFPYVRVESFSNLGVDEVPEAVAGFKPIKECRRFKGGFGFEKLMRVPFPREVVKSLEEQGDGSRVVHSDGYVYVHEDYQKHSYWCSYENHSDGVKGALKDKAVEAFFGYLESLVGQVVSPSQIFLENMIVHMRGFGRSKGVTWDIPDNGKYVVRFSFGKPSYVGIGLTTNEGLEDFFSRDQDLLEIGGFFYRGLFASEIDGAEKLVSE